MAQIKDDTHIENKRNQLTKRQLRQMAESQRKAHCIRSLAANIQTKSV